MRLGHLFYLKDELNFNCGLGQGVSGNALVLLLICCPEIKFCPQCLTEMLDLAVIPAKKCFNNTQLLTL